ncbi:MAG: ABC transporter permease [Actinomycetes bacterium]
MTTSPPVAADHPPVGSGADQRDELVLTGAWTPPLRLLRDVVAARALVATLGRKSFFVQYRRASLGVLWAVGLPLVQAIVLAVVFSRVARFDVPDYTVFVLSGVVAFSFFQSTLSTGATAIVDNSGLSSKVYFPRAVLPLSQCVSGLFLLASSLVVLLVAALVLGAPVGLRTLLVVPGVLLLLLLTTSLVLVLSVVHVYLRDTKYLVQAASVGWLWLTPVVYPIDALGGALRVLVEVNPVTGPVQLFHAAFTTGAGSLMPVWWSVGWVVALAAAAVLLHARYDRVLADLL